MKNIKFNKIYPALGIVLAMSVFLAACGNHNANNNTADNGSIQTEVISNREGFSIREISDDLFDRMKTGNTYKEECMVPREDLRYILVLHKDKDGQQK